MVILAGRIEDVLDVPIQRSHHADPGEHRRAAGGRDQDQRLHRGLGLCASRSVEVA
jgi:hypothetical protein